MKLLISIIILTLLGVCYTQTRPGYTPMSPEDYTNNTLIETLRDAGIDFILQRAYNNGSIANMNFTINNTNYILNMTTETIWYYDMNFSLVNAQEDSIEAAFIIWYYPGNETNTISANTYSVEYGPASAATNPGSSYAPVPQEEYNSTLIQALANNGKDFIVNGLVASGDIPPGQYNITSIASILQENVTTGANYQFDLYFANANGLNGVHGEFRESYNNVTGDMEVTAYRSSPAGATPTGGEGWTTPTDATTPPTDTAAAPTDATTTDTTAAPTDTTATATDTAAAPTDTTATDTAATPTDATATDTATTPADTGATDAATTPTDATTTDTAAAPTGATTTDTTAAPTDATATDTTAAPTDATATPAATGATGTTTGGTGAVTTVPIPDGATTPVSDATI